MTNEKFARDIINKALEINHFSVITECVKTIHNNKTVNVVPYKGDGIRMFKDSDKNINILYPSQVTIQESEYLAKVLSSGEIFDNADKVENAAKYVTMTTIPSNAIVHQGLVPPNEKLMPMTQAVVGKMNPETGFDVDNDADLLNGYNLIKDTLNSAETKSTADAIARDYLSLDKDEKIPDGIDIHGVKKAIDELKDFDSDNEKLIDDSEWDELEMDDEPVENEDGDTPVQEGFFTKKPKKLKPIPARDIVAYITVEMNAIQDTNDQAMLSGYTCSKLELADFYLTCIDTQDDRFIVPHTRQFIVQFQNDLNRLLTQILKLKPINRNDRVWKIDVNYPEGWRG